MSTITYQYECPLMVTSQISADLVTLAEEPLMPERLFRSFPFIK
jgi:hypothetical protein